MTRTRAQDYEDKKRLILNKAAALIALKGFDQATMQDVAKACGSSKSHIYHYFPSKEDLLFAIVHDHITRQAEDLTRIVKLPLPAEARFEQFVESFVQGAARERNEHIILMNALKYLPAAELKLVRSLEQHMTALMSTLLDAINPQLAARTHTRKPYALLLFGMMIWTFSWYKPSGLISPKALAGFIAQLILHGVKSEVVTASPLTHPAFTNLG